MKINNYHLIGAVLCIIYVNLAYNKSGEPPNIAINWHPYIRQSSLFINKCHIHHWMISACLLLVLLPMQLNKKSINLILSIITGFLVIFMIQGLSYKDRFQL